MAIAPALAQAQSPTADPHEVQPERPTVATHAGTVARGWLEVESGLQFDRFSDRSHGGSIPTVFKLGVGPRLQLNIQTPVVHPAGGNTTALGDIAAGLKWRLVEDARVVGDFAILPSIKAPTASTASGAGTGTTDFALLLISSHELGPVSMDVNLGYTRRSGNGAVAPRHSELWTVAFGGPWHGRWGWSAEVYGYPGTPGPSGSAPVVAILVGPTISLRKYLTLDAGFIGPLRGPQPRSIYAGVVYNVGRIFH